MCFIGNGFKNTCLKRGSCLSGKRSLTRGYHKWIFVNDMDFCYRYEAPEVNEVSILIMLSLVKLTDRAKEHILFVYSGLYVRLTLVWKVVSNVSGKG